MQAASALRSLLVCSAKARNMPLASGREHVERGRLHRLGDAERQPAAIDKMMPSPPRTSERTRLGMAERQEGGDARAHRIAHHVGASRCPR